MMDPLVAADCDCTDLDGFMLNVERLMASELVALSSHEVVAAAIFLWCRAWKQTPAASLPNDDRVLASFSRLSLTRFKKLKEQILRGFVECTDGRLYHRVLATEATNAYRRKTEFKKRRETDAERLKKWRSSKGETPIETPIETRFVREGQGQGQGQGQGLPVVVSVSEANASPTESRATDVAPFDRWWSVYPEKVGKAEARKKFALAVLKTTLDVLMAGVERYKATKPEDRPWANPATWLHQERWLDEPAAPHANGKDPNESAPDKPEDIWRGRLVYHRDKGGWVPERWGPPPEDPLCQVLPALLIEFGHRERVG